MVAWRSIHSQCEGVLFVAFDEMCVNSWIIKWSSATDWSTMVGFQTIALSFKSNGKMKILKTFYLLIYLYSPIKRCSIYRNVFFLGKQVNKKRRVFRIVKMLHDLFSICFIFSFFFKNNISFIKNLSSKLYRPPRVSN